MNKKIEDDNMDEVMLPGFRFHPTDEELVGFYLKRKIQKQQLPIELIKQVDIYKYDPWDLPKLASTGEKEWYFYCPRDRKYRNSARPNRVTGAGFWKATGTDRPIYSSDGTKCIGLKKSLVFYRGRAAKGLKTDWMMHEFRLPSIPDQGSPKKIFEKQFPPNDSWAICRIFKKINSVAQRTLSQSWVSPSPETTAASDMFTQGALSTCFGSENISCTTETGSLQLFSNNNSHSVSINTTTCKSPPFLFPAADLPTGFMFSPLETSEPVSGFSLSSLQDMEGSLENGEGEIGLRNKNPSEALASDQWDNIRPVIFPFSLPSSNPSDSWKSSQSWDSPPFPGEMSITYSTNKCYT